VNRIKYLHIHLFTFLVIWLGLFLDSSRVDNQLAASFVSFLAFLWVYRAVSKSSQHMMLAGLVIAFCGELFFSLLLGMYTYRLENLPAYVPFGHAIVYVSVYYIVKEPLVKQYKEKIIKVLFILMIIYSSLWLLIGDDSFGFLCMLVILFLFKRYPTTKLFFLIMFFTIAYLEIIGTHYGCWVWPDVWFDKVSFVSSANPPSAISVFYFGFDAGCLWLYKRYDRKRWARLRVIQSRMSSAA